MNWGYKLMWTFIVFAGMMLYLVFRSFQTPVELVEKDYYKSELVYQQVIDGAGRANALSATPQFVQSGNNIVLRMPTEMKSKKMSGSVLFYCVYDSGKDKKFSLAPDQNGIQLFANTLTPGRYLVKVAWVSDLKNYYAEQNITVL